MNLDNLVYTVKEVSKILHTNTTYIYKLINTGSLPAIKLGSYKIRKESLCRFLEKNEGNDLTEPDNVVKINIRKII